jgi:uncharacterized protein YqfA (UPF0365 family)
VTAVPMRGDGAESPAQYGEYNRTGERGLPSQGRRIGLASYTSRVIHEAESIGAPVPSKGLDSGTAHQLLPIDIADVGWAGTSGRNCGSIKKADKPVTQARAEERRAMTAAAEQEMITQVPEILAKLMGAEV